MSDSLNIRYFGSAYELRYSTVYATDGSGGKYTKEPRLRGCGAGVAVSNHYQHPLLCRIVGGIAASVPGRQTVPRAELVAVIIVLEMDKYIK